MKKLLFACASLMLISSAMAADGADVKINGQLRVRFSGAENKDSASFAERTWDNKTEQRTLLGLTFTKSEDLTAKVTLVATGEWGNTGTSNTSGQLAATGSDASVLVYEAWAFWKAMDNFSVKVGRGALDLADGSVVSKNLNMQAPYSFEGIVGLYFHDMFNLSVFAVKGMNDGPETGTDSADVNLYAVSADLKLAPEFLKMFNIALIQSKATGVGGFSGAADEKMRLSLTLAGDNSGVDYRGTYAMYTGELLSTGTTTDHDASMMDLEAGYTLKDVMNLRVSALYHTDSGEKSGGDVESYDPFYYNKHDNAGMMDIIGWGNSTYYKLGVSVEPMEMLTAGVDFYMFSKTETTDSVYDVDHSAITAVGTASGDDVGSELDLWVKKTLSNGTETWARYGMFKADDAVGASAKDISDFQVGATFSF